MHRFALAGVCAAAVIVAGIFAYQVMAAPTAYDADVNHDGHVNLLDLGAAASYYGQSAPLPTATPAVRCDLSGRNLNGIRIAGQNFDDCALVGASLSGMDAGYATLRRADMSQANVPASSFDHADLTDVRLTGAFALGSHLQAAILVSADLTGANLTNADGTNANFTGATTTAADVSGVIWNNTICPDGSNSDTHGNTCIGYGF